MERVFDTSVAPAGILVGIPKVKVVVALRSAPVPTLTIAPKSPRPLVIVGVAMTEAAVLETAVIAAPAAAVVVDMTVEVESIRGIELMEVVPARVVAGAAQVAGQVKGP
jgi:hypothetical protein